MWVSLCYSILKGVLSTYDLLGGNGTSHRPYNGLLLLHIVRKHPTERCVRAWRRQARMAEASTHGGGKRRHYYTLLLPHIVRKYPTERCVRAWRRQARMAEASAATTIHFSFPT